ncbi:nitroreductase family protein, partial [Escherichia coli]|uniref:nitroreductase family protein n=1 Tax=Escherichia coli TaxID=562 RepID=UPI002739809C
IAMSQEVLDLLLRRRSVKPAAMVAPGPTAEQLDTILTAASRVPDHKKLAPWRFVVFEGQARADFGRVLVKACLAEDKETP